MRNADVLPGEPQTQGKAGKMNPFIRHALRAGFTIEEIFNLTKIDRWFLVQIKEIVFLKKCLRQPINCYQLSTMNSQLASDQIKEIVDFEDELAAHTN